MSRHPFTSGLIFACLAASTLGSVAGVATDPITWYSCDGEGTVQAANAGGWVLGGLAVRALDLGLLPAGPHEHAWNIDDDQARPVASGVYFLRLSAGAAHGIQKITVVR